MSDLTITLDDARLDDLLVDGEAAVEYLLAATWRGHGTAVFVLQTVLAALGKHEAKHESPKQSDSA